ncbi:hypothetical protein GCM10023205_79450 [Yinghuangia aomiensis]|uniref:Uncharacterized protein n=1 Tax=Yinghuangia aomiensis TaxID=676205 RepID=A0ABP9IDU1_9ACTN
MICPECAWEADAVRAGRRTRKQIREAPKNLAKQLGVGDAKFYAMGPAGCTGCDYAHQPVPKDRRGSRVDAG